jgi:protein-tyrosine-phosphatase
MNHRKTAAPLLLFVCTGNICRSPMAAAIVADEAHSAGINLRVASAGTGALFGAPAYSPATDALKIVGLSLAEHRSRPLTRQMVADATLVIAVTGRHRDDLRHFFPNDAAKIVSFHDITGLGDLDDPYGADRLEFLKLRDTLKKGAPKIVAAVAGRNRTV